MRARLSVAALVLLATLASCGTRLPDAAFEQPTARSTRQLTAREDTPSADNSLRDYNGNGVHTGLDWGKSDPTAPRVRDCFAIARWSDGARRWTDATGAFPFCYPDAHQYQSPALEQGN